MPGRMVRMLAVATVGIAFASLAILVATGGTPRRTPSPGPSGTIPAAAGSATPPPSRTAAGSSTGPAVAPAASSPPTGVSPSIEPTASPTATPSPSPIDPTADSDGDLLLDGFEQEWGVSDPARADSDGDGLADSAEDVDADGLGALGEQRSGTSPATADTDADGRPDGADDADDDGVAEGTEQDDRPVPRSLRPRLAAAKGDAFVSYRNGCHSGAYEATVHACEFGDPEASRTVVVFGDSHALQWAPGIVRAGETNGWHVIVITKSGCPSVRVSFTTPVFPGAGVSCDRWRQGAVTWIRAHPPEVILVTNSHGYRVIDSRGRRVEPDVARQLWERGLSATLAALPRTSATMVIADTPHLVDDVPRCLTANPRRISECQTTRAKAYSLARDDAERAAADANGVTFVDLSGLVCSYDPCPLVVGNVLMWRDRGHLTATFARLLAPSFATLLEDAVRAP